MKNLLIAMMPDLDIAKLLPLLKEVTFSAGDIVQAVDAPIEHIFFLSSGAASVMMRVGSPSMHVQMIGREGLIGLEALLGGEKSEFKIVLDTDAVGWKVSAKEFLPLLDSSVLLAQLLSRYNRFAQVQIGFHASFVAGWLLYHRAAALLLMISDRVGQPYFSITHAQLAKRLGARRPGVTVALQKLEVHSLIQCRRSKITIIDREQLIEACSGAYGQCEKAYERIMGYTPTGNSKAAKSSGFLHALH